MLPVTCIWKVESDHLPLEFNFDLASCVNVGEEKADLNLFIENIVWNNDYAQLYCYAMLAQDVREKFDFASRLIDTDVNEALRVFSELLKQRAECMK